ncbi:hypothetical protein B2A_15586, partial [mine drainage metagenome]
MPALVVIRRSRWSRATHGAQSQTYRDAPSHGKPVRIRILRKRYRCQDCEQTAFDPIPDLDGKRRA